MKSIKVIGLGGIGSYLIEPLSRYLNCNKSEVEITLIDGDEYENKNKQRQNFKKKGNKAEVKEEELQELFPNIYFKSKPEYVDDSNVVSMIRDGDIVFLCVDNHSTRKTVSKRCEELNDIVLISGGNDYTDGDVNVFIRKNGADGKDHNRTLTELFPKIANPEDKNPSTLTEDDREGCERESEDNPQLLFTNLAIASAMCNCYYACEQNKLNFERVCVDILSLCSRTKPEEGF